jgi:hypothetical protein
VLQEVVLEVLQEGVLEVALEMGGTGKGGVAQGAVKRLACPHRVLQLQKGP